MTLQPRLDTPNGQAFNRFPSGADLEPLCSFDIRFGSVPTVPTPTGTRMLFSVVSGSVSGQSLRGDIVPGSIDWVTIGSDGVARVEVRAMIHTHDGAFIQLTTTGRADLGKHIDRFLAGEEVLASEAYIRTCPMFETTDERYDWLNRVVAVARCDLSISRILYNVSSLR